MNRALCSCFKGFFLRQYWSEVTHSFQNCYTRAKVHALSPKKLAPGLRQLAEGMLALVYPPRCSVCLKSVQTFSCRFLCENCLSRVLHAEIPPVRYWQNSGDFDLARRHGLCDLAAWYYEDALMALVPRMKYQDRPSLARVFAEIAAQRLREMMAAVLTEAAKDSPSPPVLIPVPLHPRRQRERGYNQSLLIARALSEMWNIELLPQALRRTRFTQPQVKLNADERAQNVSEVFAPHHAEKIAGRTVLLVDDVITTGATVSACAQALHQAGAAGVIAVALARTGSAFHVKG